MTTFMRRGSLSCSVQVILVRLDVCKMWIACICDCFLLFFLLNCCVSSFLSRINPSSLPIETLGREHPANSLHLRRSKLCLQAFSTRWLRAVSKLISASVSDNELIISELARFAVPPPQTCALSRFSLRVYVWLDARDCQSPLGMNVEDLFRPVH